MSIENTEKLSRLLPHAPFLTEGAIGLRLRAEYGFQPDPHIALAASVVDPQWHGPLRALYNGYVDVAEAHQLPILLGTPTRRSNQARIEASPWAGEDVNQSCVHFLEQLRSSRPQNQDRVKITGLMGCRGDAYSAAEGLESEEAYRFHSWQARRLANAGADVLMAGIMPTLPEARGMARAMADTGLPYLISFMLREDGRLLDGTWLHEAIRTIDGSVSVGPAAYMANCIHPLRLLEALSHPSNAIPEVHKRFRGIQANASALSPEALDGSETVLSDTPESLAQAMKRLRDAFPLNIVGGCCGTNHLHLQAFARLLTSGNR